MRTSIAWLPNIAVPNLHIRSSKYELEIALHNVGIFRYVHEYAKDKHFERYLLVPALKTMDQLRAFLLELDDDKGDAGHTQCQKAYSARSWIKSRSQDSEIGELDWALMGLAKARRTCCSCHENDSFKKSGRYAPLHVQIQVA